MALSEPVPAVPSRGLGRLRPRTLRGRLALWYAAILAVVLIAFCGVSYLMMLSIEADEEQSGIDDEELERERFTDMVYTLLGVGLPISLGLAAAGGLLLSRRTLQPMEDVVRTANSLDAGRLAERIAVRPNDASEVEHLARALNGMLDRIQRSVEATRRFTADASHELRTPLAILGNELEIALRRPRSNDELRVTMGSALEEIGKLSRLVDGLLALARSDAGELRLDRTPVDLGEVVRDTIEPYHAMAAKRRLSFETELPHGLVVLADPLWLGRAIANVLDNACKFTPEGGRVAITLDRQGDQVRCAVSDSGGSLGAEERQRVFDRFYRGPATRRAASGVGLGLPLAREIIRALGGEMGIDDGGSDAGNVFWIRLPRADAALS